MITLIWAMDENWLVGKDSKLPWHIKEDLKYFKSKTNDQIVLMGHITYMSMKGYYKDKPFPFKKVYVANLEDTTYKDATLIKDINAFLANNKENLFVIGGPTIYRLSLPYADRLLITYILNRYEGNVYFPKFDLNKFKLLNYKTENMLIFSEYERIK
ncbi:dihydrofolate reductase [Haploplasma modicum]|uniref:dihydrofolate reductase n=1 Tax=Haploplasma modicum TaxID=2150 RepID=UPI00047C8D42|nr:dihydrofolate reductase [Haploplasma modicum]